MEACPHVRGLESVKNEALFTPRMWACIMCGTTESVWACLQCSNIACGRFNEEHAVKHFNDKGHPLALEVNKKYLYCYQCDNYVFNDNSYEQIALIRETLKEIETQVFNESLTRSGCVIRGASTATLNEDNRLEKEHSKLEDRQYTAVCHWRLSILSKVFNGFRKNIKYNKKDKTNDVLNKTVDSKAEPPRKRRKVIIPGVTGLRNLGNTCYMNSVLQVLSHLQFFRQSFLLLNKSKAVEQPCVTSTPKNDRSLSALYQRQTTVECYEHITMPLRKGKTWPRNKREKLQRNNNILVEEVLQQNRSKVEVKDDRLHVNNSKEDVNETMQASNSINVSKEDCVSLQVNNLTVEAKVDVKDDMLPMNNSIRDAKENLQVHNYSINVGTGDNGTLQVSNLIVETKEDGVLQGNISGIEVKDDSLQVLNNSSLIVSKINYDGQLLDGQLLDGQILDGGLGKTLPVMDHLTEDKMNNDGQLLDGGLDKTLPVIDHLTAYSKEDKINYDGQVLDGGLYKTLPVIDHLTEDTKEDKMDFDGQLLDGQLLDGQVLDGQVLDGQVPDGELDKTLPVIDRVTEDTKEDKMDFDGQLLDVQVLDGGLDKTLPVMDHLTEDTKEDKMDCDGQLLDGQTLDGGLDQTLPVIDHLTEDTKEDKMNNDGQILDGGFDKTLPVVDHSTEDTKRDKMDYDGQLLGGQLLGGQLLGGQLLDGQLLDGQLLDGQILDGGLDKTLPVMNHLTEDTKRDKMNDSRKINSTTSDGGQNKQVLFSDELHALFRVMWSGKWAIVTPLAVLHAVWHLIPSFLGYSQHDAQEFLCEFLERLQRELEEHCPSNDSISDVIQPKDILPNAFEGKLVSEVMCHNCRGVSTTREQFWDLSLEFPDRYQVKPRSSRGRLPPRRPSMDSCHLTEMLSKFTQNEMLEGRSYRCEKCCVSSSDPLQFAQKQLQIAGLPEVLRLHLKRFRWYCQTRGKIISHVGFDMELDMKPYCHNSYLTSYSDQDFLYSLSGVIIHLGTGFDSGHYVAYCWNEQADSWVYYNDARVSLCSYLDVLKSQAYILLYTRCNGKTQQTFNNFTIPESPM